MKKNEAAKKGNILTFFKPLSQNSQDSQPSASQTSLPPLSPLPGSPVSTPTSRRDTPPPRTSFSRDAVINGSDDDDSDGSLPDLWAALPPPNAFPPPRDRNSCVTPKSKRKAFAILSSPSMGIRQQPKHKFDMKTLLAHAANDAAAEETARQAAEILRNDHRSSGNPKAREQQQAAEIQEHMMGLMENGQDEVDRDKIKRALERTEAKAVRGRWYFFDNDIDASAAARTPFPEEAATGRWEFLDDAEARHGYIEHGVVQAVLSKKSDLPDEIFLWLLDELCLEPQEVLRGKYVEILALCPAQVFQLLDTEALCGLFRRLGSGRESTDLSARLEMVPAIGEPYPGRTWSRLGSVLRLLSAVAARMSEEATAGAVKLLLRLGVDGVVQETVGLALAYQGAMQNLTAAVPLSRWDSFVSPPPHAGALTPYLLTPPSAQMSARRSTRAWRNLA